MGREVGISPGQIPSPTPFLTRLVNMKMIIVVMMLYNGEDGGNGDISDNMLKRSVLKLRNRR